MDLKLSGKRALVTGSTAGIGFAIAKALVNEGAAVVLNGRSELRVSDAVRKLNSESNNNGTISGIDADLTTKAGVNRLFQHHSQFDIVINNLGAYEAKNFEALSGEDLERMFNTNVVSGAMVSKLYLAGMKAKNWGRIVFVASEAGVNIPPDMIHYGVSKAAQLAFARGLSETTAGTGVTINSVIPGPTYSEGVSKFLDEVIESKEGDKSELERTFLNNLRPTSLIKRFATAEEVASLVTYLASPLASATNGAAVRVEGGLLRNFI